MLLQANALNIPLADNSVHCAITSPPYWGLRSYVADDDPLKKHELGMEEVPDCRGWATGEPCGECYVCHMVAVYREVRRVLRDDGTCWLNVGDSYAVNGGARDYGSSDGFTSRGDAPGGPRRAPDGLKPKDLVGIPWRVAFALQADGWWLRSDIIWAKPNPMPESVTDRPTKSHEYLFLLAKSARYYYDAEAVKEGSEMKPQNRYTDGRGVKDEGYQPHRKAPGMTAPAGRNRRSVWTIATAPYAGAHFATYPPALVEPCLLAGTSARGVCPACGAPWERVVERVREHGLDDAAFPKTRDLEAHNGHRRLHARVKAARDAGEPHDNPLGGSVTTGWRPNCAHNGGDLWVKYPPEPKSKRGDDLARSDLRLVAWQAECNRIQAVRADLLARYATVQTVPAVVLDPFNGSGTTGMVARKHGRRYVGLDISGAYLRELALPRAENKQTAQSLATLPLFSAEAAA